MPGTTDSNSDMVGDFDEPVSHGSGSGVFSKGGGISTGIYLGFDLPYVLFAADVIDYAA